MMCDHTWFCNKEGKLPRNLCESSDVQAFRTKAVFELSVNHLAFLPPTGTQSGTKSILMER